MKPDELAALAQLDQDEATIRDVILEAVLLAAYWQTLKTAGIPQATCNAMALRYQEAVLHCCDFEEDFE